MAVITLSPQEFAAAKAAAKSGTNSNSNSTWSPRGGTTVGASHSHNNNNNNNNHSPYYNNHYNAASGSGKKRSRRVGNNAAPRRTLSDDSHGSWSNCAHSHDPSLSDDSNSTASTSLHNYRPRSDSHGSQNSSNGYSNNYNNYQHSPKRQPYSPRKNTSPNSPNPCGYNSSNSKPSMNVMSAAEKAMYVALDCEMVGVGVDGLTSQLARVTAIDWDGHILYDTYITPDRPVTDYRTYVSGITAEHFQSSSSSSSSIVDFETCRTTVAALLQDKILIGHALKNDLHALQLHHPWFMTRDTAKYEPFMKLREELQDGGILWPRKLKDLALEKLHRDIQLPGVPHSPYEDAMAALDLYKAVRGKWEKVMEYKISKTQQILLQHANQLHVQE